MEKLPCGGTGRKLGSLISSVNYEGVGGELMESEKEMSNPNINNLSKYNKKALTCLKEQLGKRQQKVDIIYHLS